MPILFIIFNRPDTTQVVFDAIKKHQPKYLYVAADGPRETSAQDITLCQQSRAIIDQVDWECEVKTLFREENLGCKLGVSSAITWFFENVEAGIILEDDCVPHQSFFRFTTEMLEKYKNEDKVMMITGLNAISDYQSTTSYFFSRYFFIWGWATWRRAWQKYDVEMHEWPQVKAGGLEKYYTDPNVRVSMEQAFEATYLGRIDTWDYQWTFTCLIHEGLSIVPAKNLISNIGLSGVHFSGEATEYQCLPTFNLYEKSSVEPSLISENFIFDSIYERKTFHPKFKIIGSIRDFLARSKKLKTFYHWIKKIDSKHTEPKML